MMLSRAAERVYWTGRYLERAENTARLVQQYSQLLLDLPEEAGVRWTELVRIVGAAAEYEQSGRAGSESDVLRYLLCETGYSPSLAYSLALARDNIRNTRDLLPTECWESVNELYRFARRRLDAAARGEDRFEILSECINRCLQINGILAVTMSHDSPYHFLTLGQNIERADMTSRIVDVAGAYIRHNERLVQRYGSILWTNVLKTVSAFQMYRQFCQPQVQGRRVVDFLLRDRAFPKAIGASVDAAQRACGRLPRCAETVAALEDVLAVVEVPTPDVPVAEDVSLLMDTVQRRLNAVHNAVASTWFLPGDTAS